MRALVRSFDGLLRRAEGVFEFNADPDCLLRLRVTHTLHRLLLPDGDVPAGSPALELHLWNEHIPRLPAEGPDVTWAMRMRRRLIDSLRAVGHQIRRDPRLAGVQAVGGVTVLLVPDAHAGAERLVSRLGFTVFPYHNPLGRFGEFWENFYTWGLMWTFNAASLRQRRLLHLRRAEVWMSIGEFLRRYGGEAVAEAEREVTPASR